MRQRTLSCALLTLVTVLVTSTVAGVSQAQSQEALALDRYNPSAAGDRFFGTASPYALGHLEFHGGVIGDYAHDPLVLRQETTEGSQDVGSVVEHQLFMHFNATLALWKRLSVNLNFPVAVFQDGEDPSYGDTSFTSPRFSQGGDLRLGLRGLLWGEDDGLIQIGFGGYLWFPSGADTEGSFVGNGGVRGLPQAVVGGTFERFVWSVDVGPELRNSATFANSSQGTLFAYNVGAGYLLGEDKDVQAGAELLGAVELTNGDKRSLNLEALAGVKWRFVDNVVGGVAIGPGLTTGVGTPNVRGLLSLIYTPQQKPADRDRDGIIDDEDACPDTPGVVELKGCPRPVDTDGDGIFDPDDACPLVAGEANDDRTKHGCPPPPPAPTDSDGDGIVDAQDYCPEVAGVPNLEDKTKHGCPPMPKDSDGDGILDGDDACPLKAGVPNTDKSQHGCPPLDSDGDGILDAVDACPKRAGFPNADAKKHGCPKVVVTAKEIIILERIEFDTGKSTIRSESRSIVAGVADVLKSHPDILRIEIQGHTDNQGSPQFNKILSDERARAVMRAITALGVDKGRMTHKGHGPDKPIAENNTPDGRQTNRRVQFVILERKKP